MNVLSMLLPLVMLFQPAVAKLDVKLYTAQQSVQPGGSIDLVIEIDVEQDWHIYHPIILDSGAPTTISLDLPPGITADELHFPIPQLGAEAKLEYLALDGKVLVLTALHVGPDVSPGSHEIKAGVFALLCKKLCLPANATTTLTLTVSPDTPAPTNQELFEQARALLPKPLAKAPFIRGSHLKVSRNELGLDQEAVVVLTVNVQKQHHIQDRNPGVEGLIPARLFIEPLNGIEFAEQKWPQPHVREMPYVGKVRELSGRFEIRAPFKLVDDKFPSGPIALRVLFTYQCCTDAGTCYPPDTVSGVIRFTADTPNAPLDDGVVQGTLFPGRDVSAGGPLAQGDVSAPTLIDVPAADEPGEQATGIVVPELTAEDWADHIPWQPWQPGLAEEVSRRGHLVYVDYTAVWCPTCQANKHVVLETDAVRSKMRDLGVIPIKADFTTRNAAMQKEITRWAPTVPVNLIYPAGKPDTIARLPIVLTQRTVIEALEDPEAYAARTEAPQNLLLVLLAGFLGGLILNVMPCVLPVISIKILSFVQQAGEDPKRVLRLGLAFCAGIMVWFWAFAALSAKGQLPWQYPQVVVALGSILFVFSLNLFGVFEVFLPGAAAGKIDALAGREGYTGAFLKGLLATLLGTACTAPFLAGAMVYALSQPAWIVFAVFSAAGLGMAAPYLILSAKPAWLKFIPKPGPWMVTFKQAAGFVLLGTVVWLLWILADQLDAQGVVWTVAFWGFLGLAVWMLGKAKPTWERRHQVTMWLASLAVTAVGLWFCYFVMYDWGPRAG